MVLSLTSRYALQALVYLGAQAPEPAYAWEIAQKTGIPARYLAKIMHTLARHRLVTSVRGRGGGFRLARPPEAIVLHEVVSLFEDPSFPQDCLLGQKFCSDQAPCQAHAVWQPISERLRTFFQTTTLADLIRRSPAGPPLPAAETAPSSAADTP